MKLTRKTDYALRLLVYLAQQGSQFVISSRQFAIQEKLSHKFLQGVVGDLVENGLLKSSPGVGGGVCLKLLPEKVSFLQVILAVEGPIFLLDCLENSHSCGEYVKCHIHSVIYKAQAAMSQIFASTTILDLIKAEGFP